MSKQNTIDDGYYHFREHEKKGSPLGLVYRVFERKIELFHPEKKQWVRSKFDIDALEMDLSQGRLKKVKHDKVAAFLKKFKNG